MNKISSYEEKIISILQSARIKFEREKQFKDLRKGTFRYDFFLKDKNILIEMDGQFHFQPIVGRDKLLTQQENDRLKNEYALAQGYQLYRIPYWELNSVNSFNDLLSSKFLVTSKFHNDIIWRNYSKTLKN